jgi:hypothetical protein
LTEHTDFDSWLSVVMWKLADQPMTTSEKFDAAVR